MAWSRCSASWRGCGSRDQKLLFWVALYSLEPLLAQSLVAFRIPFPYVFSLGVLQPLISIGDISLWFLLLYLLQLDDRPRLLRWTRTLSIISLIAASLDGLMTIWAFDLPNPIWFQIPDAILTLIFTSLEAFPLLLIALALRKRLDAARWLVAIFAFVRDGLIVLRTALEQGARFTHISGDKIAAPLFAINGNQFKRSYSGIHAPLYCYRVRGLRYTVEQGRRQGALEQEFRSAQELQRVLIPETLPSVPGYSITSAYRPAEEVGGDFFQLIPQVGGATLLILGDVSGKGLKAAMTVSLIVGAARSLAGDVGGSRGNSLRLEPAFARPCAGWICDLPGSAPGCGWRVRHGKRRSSATLSESAGVEPSASIAAGVSAGCRV